MSKKTVSFENDKSPDDIFITNLVSMFLELSKYNHLDNSKNKKLIYELCEILVKQLPNNKETFYINILESTIDDIKNKF